jgi:hypothetical protein
MVGALHGQIEANWEMARVRRYSSRDAAGLQALAADPGGATRASSPFWRACAGSANSIRYRALLCQRSKWGVMADNSYVGNAAMDSKDHRGWIIGHFLDQADGVRASDEVEIKWGIHPAGEARHDWQTDEHRTTVIAVSLWRAYQSTGWLSVPGRRPPVPHWCSRGR